MKADQLILGNIVTLDQRFPVFKALTVKGGLVQYVGTEEMARKLCDEHTEVLDYGDNYVYPGMIEGHCHASLAGPRLAFFADLSAGKTLDDYIAILKDYVAAHPDNEFYYGAGWCASDWTPSAAILDEICSDKPIALNSIDAHSIWLNTKGMEKFDITRTTVEEWDTSIIRVDENGDPTGFISEGPCNSIINKMNAFADEDLKYALLKWQDFALSLGITAYYEAGATARHLEIVSQLIKEGKWKIREYAGYVINERDPDYVARVREAKAMADKYNCEYLQVIGVKIFMDGVIEAHTAWTVDPYDDQEGYTGVKRFCDFDRVCDLYRECEKLGLNVHQHTIGDGAVKFALDCLEQVETETGNMHMRSALAHVQMVQPEDIKRLCALNAVALVAPLWMYRDEEGIYSQTVRYIGDKRTFYCYPMNSFLKNSGIIAFHSDYPVSSAISLPRSIYMACKRSDPHHEVYHQWNPDECITREDALAGLTAGPAYEVYQEDHLGKLQIGYVANMTVFDKDFLHDDLEEVADSKVVATIIDGKEVYRG